MSELKSGVYSQQVIEFVTVADQFCKHLARAGSYQPSEFLSVMQRLLPFLYLKTLTLPRFESHFEEGNERFVREEEYNRIESSIATLLGQADGFEEPSGQFLTATGEPASASISEYLADIYQDVRDCLLQYQTGTEEVMNDAIWECSMTFETIWGRKLISVLRAVHDIVYSGTGDSDSQAGTNREPGSGFTGDKSEWFITRRQKDYDRD